jgi:hypothetical protein
VERERESMRPGQGERRGKGVVGEDKEGEIKRMTRGTQHISVWRRELKELL